MADNSEIQKVCTIFLQFFNHILLFEILIKTVQDNHISGLFLSTVLPLSVIISVSATRWLPVIPVPVSITAITLFMNDNDYLAVFEKKEKVLPMV